VKVPELLSTTSRDKATKGDCAKIDKLSINEKKSVKLLVIILFIPKKFIVKELIATNY
jgi:hypothetical protein